MADKAALIMRWQEKAEHDLIAAKLAIEKNTDINDIACFHAQQSAEKYLKSHLVRCEIDFKKSHDLIYLADLIAQQHDAISDELYSALERLILLLCIFCIFCAKYLHLLSAAFAVHPAPLALGGCAGIHFLIIMGAHVLCVWTTIFPFGMRAYARATEYAVEIRYPDSIFEPSTADAQRAIADAEYVKRSIIALQ